MTKTIITIPTTTTTTTIIIIIIIIIITYLIIKIKEGAIYSVITCCMPDCTRVY